MQMKILMRAVLRKKAHLYVNTVQSRFTTVTLGLRSRQVCLCPRNLDRKFAIHGLRPDRDLRK